MVKLGMVNLMKKYFVLLIFVGMISVPSAFAEDHSHTTFHSHDGYISHSHGFRHNHNINEEHGEIDWHSESNGVDAVHENSKIVEPEPPLNEPHTHSQTHAHGEFPEHTHTVDHHNHATGTNHPFEVFHVYPNADAQHQASKGLVESTPDPPPKPKPVPPPPPPSTPPPPPTPIQHVPAPQTGGGGVTPPSVTPPSVTTPPSSSVTVILPPVNTVLPPVVPDRQIEPTMPVDEPVEKPKRKRLRPIPRDPDIPEMLPRRCRLLKFQLPNIDIVNVEVFQKPRRVHVTVRHYVKKAISLHCYMLEFTDSEGKFIYRKEARSYRNNGRAWLRYKPEQYEKFGFSQTEFILTSKWIVDKYDMRKKFGVEFGLNFRIYAKNVPYYQPEEGHVLILRAPTDLDKDKELDVVAQYPKSEEKSAPAAPSLIRPKLTTMWANLKKE